jgi:hypothetical protein
MRYRLRTLLILLALAPPILAAIGIAVFGLKREPPTAMGTVTYRGMPVAQGTVSFVPQADDRLRYAAKTDEQGRFRVNRDAAGRPLQPGRYSVTIEVPVNGSRLKSRLMTDLQPDSENEIHFELQ